MRRASRVLHIHRITVARKLKFLAAQARLSQSHFLSGFRLGDKLQHLQFDDMESFEHTKLNQRQKNTGA